MQEFAERASAMPIASVEVVGHKLDLRSAREAP
jgi:hypothetical protein